LTPYLPFIRSKNIVKGLECVSKYVEMLLSMQQLRGGGGGGCSQSTRGGLIKMGEGMCTHNCTYMAGVWDRVCVRTTVRTWDGE
jgi:hypothetical protein